MNIHYKIEFFTDWHCGSGLSAGVDLDALVVKDKNHLPFIPGKTIKGLIREAVEELDRLSETQQIDAIKKAFGFFSKDENKREIEAVKGECFFTNATVPPVLANAVISEKTAKYFYRTISSTKINNDGVAEEHSLRKMQVTIPCCLEGKIINIPDKSMAEILKNGLRFIKRLGQNRNRGLGRCVITVIEKEDGI